MKKTLVFVALLVLPGPVYSQEQQDSPPAKMGFLEKAATIWAAPSFAQGYRNLKAEEANRMSGSTQPLPQPQQVYIYNRTQVLPTFQPSAVYISPRRPIPMIPPNGY